MAPDYWRKIQQMRLYVTNCYPGKKWRDKVNKMSDAQLTAVYMRLSSKAGVKILKQINKTPAIPKLTTYSCNICDTTYERDNPDLRECDYCGLPFKEEEDNAEQ